MNEAPHVLRGLLLAEQNRHDAAIQEFQQHLLEDPNDAFTHGRLAVSLTSLKRFEEATEHAEKAVGLSPDDPSSHFALARVLYDRNHYPEAKKSLAEAIRLNPEEPVFYFLRGAMEADDHRWQKALDDAEAGLALDPEHDGCLNLKAKCLTKLGRHGEANLALETALQRDPDNAHTHANQGWRLLEAGEHKQALEHFREALRLDPELDYARAGIVEAMKARHFVYRIFLKYLTWMSRWTVRGQWMILIGAYVVYRYGFHLANNNPGQFGWLWPILILYIAFALLTWFAAPLFNLLLRLNRFGRYALSEDQRKGATLFGLGVLTAVLLGGASVLFDQSGNDVASVLTFTGAINSVLFLIPLSTIYSLPAGKPRKTMSFAVLGIAVLAFAQIGVLYQAFSEVKGFVVVSLLERSRTLGTLFVIGVVASQFLANYLAGTRQRR